MKTRAVYVIGAEGVSGVAAWLDSLAGNPVSKGSSEIVEEVISFQMERTVSESRLGGALYSVVAVVRTR